MNYHNVFKFLLYLSIIFLTHNYLQICSSFNLTVIHNNDFHSHFEQINTFSSDCKEDEQCFGGVARTVAKVSLTFEVSCLVFSY